MFPRVGGGGGGGGEEGVSDDKCIRSQFIRKPQVVFRATILDI